MLRGEGLGLGLPLLCQDPAVLWPQEGPPAVRGMCGEAEWEESFSVSEQCWRQHEEVASVLVFPVALNTACSARCTNPAILQEPAS